MAVVAVDTGPTITATLGAASSLVPNTLVTLAPTAIVPHTPQRLGLLGSQPTQLIVHCRRGHGRGDPRGARGVLRPCGATASPVPPRSAEVREPSKERVIHRIFSRLQMTVR